jgi:hypothetical protein
MNTRETRKVSYIDWQDDEGNCGTSYAIILEAESKEEAEVELSSLTNNNKARNHAKNFRCGIPR